VLLVLGQVLVLEQVLALGQVLVLGQEQELVPHTQQPPTHLLMPPP